MKRSLLALVALTMIGLTSGCCGWWWPHYGYSPGYYAPSGGCPSGNCGVNPGPGVPPQSTYYEAPGAVQSAQQGVPVPMDGPVTFSPAVPQTAAMPLESLPTY